MFARAHEYGCVLFPSKIMFVATNSSLLFLNVCVCVCARVGVFVNGYVLF